VTPDYGFQDVVDHLRGAMGADIVDAALAAAQRTPVASAPAAAAVMPVWAFEAEGGTEDVLASSAQLWGAKLLVEALRAEGEEEAVPVPGARDRFARWAAAAGGAAPRRPPGYRGATAAS
jgi:hypothetical protein